MNTSVFSDILLPATLVVITFGLGLSITLQDIRNIITEPKNIIIGVLSQMILLPVIAFLIAWITGLKPEYSVGLILISICPGGVTSNLINFMIRANVALSMSITIVHGLITTIKIPLITTVALAVFMQKHERIEMPILDSILHIFILTIIPATFGVLIRAWKIRFAEKLENPLRIILPALLLVIYSGVIFLEGGDGRIEIGNFIYLIPVTLALNVLSTISGYYIPRLLALSKRNSCTIAVEVGMQNSTLAIFVAGTLLNNYQMAIVGVVYGSFSFFSTWLLGYLMKRYL
jgi:BASS family bile acid:Na+ symporter